MVIAGYSLGFLKLEVLEDLNFRFDMLVENTFNLQQCDLQGTQKYFNSSNNESDIREENKKKALIKNRNQSN